MTDGEKTIFVYDDFTYEKPVLLGMLYVGVVKGGEVYSFEYSADWLRNNRLSINLAPDLPLYLGRQFPEGKRIFGMFSDASPDRWGRTLMNKRERISAEKDGRKPRKLYDSDYLLGVYDETRMGGLRFKVEQDGCFLSDEKESAIPPWKYLRTLEEASRNFESEDGEPLEKWVEQLIRPGSSLGGARPKATVIDEKGQLWIAKFPSKNDEHDSGAWEMVVHDLAGMCGLNVPESRLKKFSKYGSTFMVRRFDRDGRKRVHFASAMTLLGKTDGAGAEDGIGYLDIAGFIKAYGSSPNTDLRELWKRIVFNMSVTNTDDHLRNHAFILSKDGWNLSPMFDVNPVPYGNELSLLVDEIDNKISIDLAIRTAPRFGISEREAKKISEEIISVVKTNWERIAKEYDISRGQIDYMRPAFRIQQDE